MVRQIESIHQSDLDELIAFTRSFEQRALAAFPQLPHPDASALVELLSRQLDSANGVLVRENGGIVGSLAVIGPFADYHGGRSGIFSPLVTCLVADGCEDRVFTDMLTAVGELPQLAGVDTMAISCFAHQSAQLESVSLNGFGVRCADAAQHIDALPAPQPDFDYPIEFVHWCDAVSIIEVKQSLAAHLTSSPMFMEYFDFTPEFIAWKSEQRESVHLVARDGERIIGFIEATYEGENYLTIHPRMRNICGAGVLPEYRGKGIMRELVARLADYYQAEKISTLGVDYETMNPNARGFWERYFVPYTRSAERRFDQPWGSQ